MTAVEAVRMDASNNSVNLIFAISCVMYITYYNSRVAGYNITRIVNRLFIRDGFFKIGSFTVNVLSGKIMFRDVFEWMRATIVFSNEYGIHADNDAVGDLIFANSWVMYITYYNSRVAGYIITRIVNRLFIRDGFFKIDVVYITHDYSVRVQDGYLIFRWWHSYVPKDVSEDLSHSATRLSVVLNGFELHVYNRSTLYAQLGKTFGPDVWDATAPDGNNDAAMNDENTERHNNGTTEFPEQCHQVIIRHWDNCIFDDSGKRINARFPILILALCEIYNLLVTQKTCTVRELYYKYTEHIPTQKMPESALNCISCLIEVPLYQVNIAATGKGIVYGPLHILTENSEINYLNAYGTLIPDKLGEGYALKSKAKFIVIIEKDTIFHKFIRNGDIRI
ncbi:tweek [Carabus blaptoides fortunei]